MARSNVTPDFMSSPNVGEFVALALEDYADSAEKDAAEHGQSRTAAAMIRLYRRAAQQLLGVHDDAA